MLITPKPEEVPPCWVITTLADLFVYPSSNIVDGPFGSNLRAQEYAKSGAPLLRIQNIRRYAYVPKNIKFVTHEKAADPAHSYSPGDIIVTKLGDPVGKACILPVSAGEGIIVADLIRLRLDHAHIDKKWLCYAINADGVSSQLKALTKGTTRPRVNLNHIRALRLSVPPLSEQVRITETIEALFSELDKGIESLMTASAQLKVYRCAVFRHAFEGKLTAQWREQNMDKLDDPARLLERIQEEREARHQQQLLDWQAAVRSWEEESADGKRPAKPKRQKDVLPADQPALSNLAELPIGWKWVKLGELAWSVRDGPHFSPKYEESGIPFITGGNVRPDGVDFATAKFKAPELHRDLSARCKPELAMCCTPKAEQPVSRGSARTIVSLMSGCTSRY